MIALASGFMDEVAEGAAARAMDKLHGKHIVEILITGGAGGYERACRRWAIEHNVPYYTVHNLKSDAGNDHAKRMLAILSRFEDETHPAGIVCFPGGEVLAAHAEAAGLKVWRTK